MGDARMIDAQRRVARVILVILGGLLASFVLFSSGPLRGFSVAQVPTSRFNIQFLNPSGYQSGEEEEVSTKADGSEGQTATTFHLVAWTDELPGNPSVEFRYKDPATLREITIGTATQTATPDTFEFHWDPPDTLADGPLTLYALLFDGTTEVARDTESDLTLNDKNQNPMSPNPNETEPQGETVEITYPTNGGPWGVYKPRDANNAAGVVRLTTSDAADIVLVYYTVSPPGAEPEWRQCGEESEPFFGEDYSDGIVCTLAAVHEPHEVTAVAANPNQTDEGSYNLLGADPAQDDSGDAHRTLSYFQEPEGITLTPPVQNEVPAQKCSAPIVANVVDQNGAPIHRANIDIHALGPVDELAFDNAQVRPTQGTHRQESAVNCANTPPSPAGTQGEHDFPEGPDQKHVESPAAGTDTLGNRSFSLYSPARGSTQVTAWTEFDDDDLQCSEEPTASVSIGWQEPAPAVSPLPADIQSCPRPTATSPTTTPTATETTPPDPRGCTITGTAGPEAITGTEDDDVICGLGGNDIIRGLGGNDTIFGDAGKDDLRGGDGDDRAVGGSGKDSFSGAAGNDVLEGGKDNDALIGGPGRDRIFGNVGIDTLRGSGGNDRLDGGPNDDILTGGPGNDTLFGRGGDDALSGGGGRDRCRGGGGRNQRRGCET